MKATRATVAGTALALGLALACGLAPAGPAAADEPLPAVVGGSEPPVEPVPDGWAYDLANRLMSPFCPGRTLAECPSPQAESLRMWIVVQEAAGRSKDDVLEELYARYGDDIRSTPRAEGFGTAAYVIPVVAFLVGGGLVGIFLYRWTHRGGGDGDGPPAPAPALDPDLERRLDEELAR